MFLKLFTIFTVAMVTMAASPGKAPTIQLNDGYTMPILGLGTYSGKVEDVDKLNQVVVWAIEAGYRHIDTAELYRNEDKIGQGIADAIAKGLVKREDLFITTKLWNNHHARQKVVPTLKESLHRLGLEYVDLYLVHSPTSEKDDGSSDDIDYLDTWQGMIDAKEAGLTRSIGVSNFGTEEIDRILANSKIKPAVNQVEIHPSNTNEQLVADCHSRGIAVTAYSPFGFLVSRGKPNAPPPRIDDPKLVEIAKKYRKSTSQVVLRYLIDRYVIPIPKTTSKERLAQNIDVFDFQLTDEDIDTINKFNTNTAIFG